MSGIHIFLIQRGEPQQITELMECTRKFASVKNVERPLAFEALADVGDPNFPQGGTAYIEFNTNFETETLFDEEMLDLIEKVLGELTNTILFFGLTGDNSREIIHRILKCISGKYWVVVESISFLDQNNFDKADILELSGDLFLISEKVVNYQIDHGLDCFFG